MNIKNLQHEDYCRFHEDETFCTCGAKEYYLFTMYRHLYNQLDANIQKFVNDLNTYAFSLPAPNHITPELTRMAVIIQSILHSLRQVAGLNNDDQGRPASATRHASAVRKSTEG